MNKYSEKELEDNVHLFDSTDWHCISWCQELSESFVEKYMLDMDEITWYFISLYQKLSDEFIKKYINKINIDRLIDNKNISNKIKKELRLLKEII